MYGYSYCPYNMINHIASVCVVIHTFSANIIIIPITDGSKIVPIAPVSMGIHTSSVRLIIPSA